MNDFTKEELQFLVECLDDEISTFKLSNDNYCWIMKNKIQSMIENYRDPNCQHKIDRELKKCTLCGLPSHRISCVGGWL